jgi:hypothetical protein
MVQQPKHVAVGELGEEEGIYLPTKLFRVNTNFYCFFYKFRYLYTDIISCNVLVNFLILSS